MNRKKEASDAYSKALVAASHNHYTAVALAEAAYRKEIEKAYAIYIEAVRAEARKENNHVRSKPTS